MTRINISKGLKEGKNDINTMYQQSFIPRKLIAK